MKLQDFINLDKPVEYEYEYEANGNVDQNFYQSEQLYSQGSKMNNDVVGMSKTVSPTVEVVVMEPRSLAEMPQVIQLLQKSKSVLLNLQSIDLQQAQRAVDFVAGGAYAIEGHQERVGEMVFLFTPICVQVTTIEAGVIRQVAPPQVL